MKKSIQCTRMVREMAVLVPEEEDTPARGPASSPKHTTPTRVSFSFTPPFSRPSSVAPSPTHIFLQPSAGTTPTQSRLSPLASRPRLSLTIRNVEAQALPHIVAPSPSCHTAPSPGGGSHGQAPPPSPTGDRSPCWNDPPRRPSFVTPPPEGSPISRALRGNADAFSTGNPTATAVLNSRKFLLKFRAQSIEDEFCEHYFLSHRTYFRCLAVFTVFLTAFFLALHLIQSSPDEPTFLVQLYVRSLCVALGACIGLFLFVPPKFFSRHFNSVMTLLVVVWAATLVVVSFIDAIIEVDMVVNVRIASIFTLSSLAVRTFYFYHLLTVVFVVCHLVFSVYFHVGIRDFIMILGLYFLSCAVSFETERSHRQVFKLHKSAKMDQDSVSSLLRIMLPVTVANRLLDRQIVADTFQNVTVMFAEIAGYHECSQCFDATQIVDVLNSFYTLLDYLAGDNVYQVESLGEQALLITGCPVETPKHALVMADFALRLTEQVSQKCHWPDGSAVSLKVGLHSGRVMASVIGKKRPQYNIIGDTVNTASRITAQCQAGNIHVSSDTRDLVYQSFSLTERPPRKYKGKGILKTFYLTRPNQVPGESLELPTPRQRQRLSSILSSSATRAKLQAMVITKKLCKTAASEKVPVTPTDSIVIPRLTSERRLLLVDDYQKTSLDEQRYTAMVASLFKPDRQLYKNRLRLRFRHESLESDYQNYSAASKIKAQRHCILLLALFYIVTFPFSRAVGELAANMLKSRLCNLLGCFLLAALTAKKRWWNVCGSVLLTLFGMWTVCFVMMENQYYQNVAIDPETILTETCAIFVLYRMSGLDFLLSVVSVALFTVSMGVAMAVTVGGFNPDVAFIYLMLMNMFFIVSQFTAERNAREEWVHRRRAECDKQSLGDVVSNILPAHVSTSIMAGLSVPVKTFPCVALLYSDLVGFTALSSTTPLEEMRNILHHLYLFFDSLVEESGLYKIATIGDAYLISAGCPYPCGDPVQKLVSVAFGMHEVVRSLTDQYDINMRIGIHIGPVFAGLVGARVPHYHIFGHTTRVANALETATPPGQVLVSAPAASLIGVDFVTVGPPKVVTVDGEAVPAYLVVPAVVTSAGSDSAFDAAGVDAAEVERNLNI